MDTETPAWMQRLKQAVTGQPAVSPEEQLLQNMSPVDAYKFAQEARNARVFAPEDAAANRQQTFLDALYASPVGNALSLRDAMESKWNGQQQEQQGDTEGARRNYASAAASALMGFLPGMGRIGLGSGTEGAALSARIFAGPMAKTADRSALQQAETMAKSGAAREDIWNSTGWFQGTDGKWRFEIPDNETSVSIPKNTMSGDWSAYKTALDHPDLFEAYPPMARNRVTFDHRLDDSSISLDPSPNAFDSKKFDTEIGLKGRQTFGAREIRPGKIDEVRGSFLHEGQHNVQAREGFATGNDPQTIFDDLMAQNPARDPREATELAIDMYRRTAGEVEARNVQSRMNMTPAQRRATPPWLTQDVPDEQQIVRKR